MKWITYIFLVFPFALFSQNLNLLPDPGFEEINICNIQYPYQSFRYWYDPTDGTPDAIVYCNYGLSVGVARTHSGYGTALQFIYAISPLYPPNTREYIATPLKSPLKANKKYCIDYYIMPGQTSKYGCNSVGVYFGTSHQYYPTYLIPPIAPQSDTLLTQAIGDTANWFHYVDIYNAAGGETDIVIGNFKIDSQIMFPVINPSGSVYNGAYYAFDDVSLYEMSIDAGSDALTCKENLVATIGEANNDPYFKNYYWYDPQGNLIDSLHAQIQVQPDTNTFYIEEKRVCGQSFFDTVHVVIDTVCPVIPEPPFFVPNVFSPNGDGINDTWTVQLGTKKILSIAIYNRWGVAELSNRNISTDNDKVIIWDGRTTSGMPCSEGVYYYSIELQTSKGETEKRSGYISLFR